MKTFEYPKTEYKGFSLKLARAGRAALGLGPYLKKYAWFIFLGIVGFLLAAIWAIGAYLNPWLEAHGLWLLRDIIVVVGILCFISLVAMVGIWGERKVSGRIQSRLGPMRTGGWHGWSQSLADGLKFVQKEDLIPASADRILFRIAPHLALIPPICAFAAIPFGLGWVFKQQDAALLFVLAMLGIEVLGVILGGWASNSKWSLYGAMREACQLVSYEIPMGLSLLVGVTAVGTIDLVKMGEAQRAGWFSWLIFANPFSFIAFFTYYIAALASCKRAPFDLPEGESELVAGFHTEYSGFRFVMFFFAEYAAMFAVSALAAIIFLGGWHTPWGGSESPLWLVLKGGFLVWVQMWLRWTLPRIRIDQVMHACVKYLLPLTMLLFVAGAGWQLLGSGSWNYVVRFILGLLGLGLVGLFIAGIAYGIRQRDKLVGRLARKALPGS